MTRPAATLWTMTSLPAKVPSRTGPRIGVSAVPRASVAPLLAWPDSMRPMPASRFQLMPQPGMLVAMIFSAVR
ncbi:Uncharacterised protein [Mycobacteroides abscessus subsp. abscessus]|nr:Uncharacterised protein [Mycobacteroides abscessus subsp. abscessus]